MMKFLLAPIRQFEFTSPVFDYLKHRLLSIKPLSTIIYSHPTLRKRLTRRVVNERILEIPFVFSRIPKSAKTVLDVGGCESSVALSLASLGYKVTVVDINPYPFFHPNISFMQADITSCKLDSVFDCVICLSTLEHIGLEAYGSGPIDKGDYLAIRNMYSHLSVGGSLLLTTPIGLTPKTFPLWRRYTSSGLKKLLSKFSIHEFLLGIKDSSEQWTLTKSITMDSDLPTPTGVALIHAKKV